MSAFHRVDDVRAMPALRFINFALRLAAYKGIVRALAERAQADEVDQSPARPAPSVGATGQNRTVASTPEALRAEPAFAGQIEIKGG